MVSKNEDFLVVSPEDLDRWGYGLADLKALAARVDREGYVSRAVPPGAAIVGRMPDLSITENEIKFYCEEHGQQSLTREWVRREMRFGLGGPYSGLFRPPINPWNFGSP